MSARLARGAARSARHVKVAIEGDAGKFAQAMGVASGAVETVLDRVFKLEERFVSLTKTVGRMAQGLGGAGMGLSTWVTMNAAQWEDAFAMVEKTVDAPREALKQLDRDLRQLSLEIPIPAEGLAGLGSLAGQLGITTEAIDMYVETAAKLGVATNLGAEQAIFQLSQFSNIMGTAEDKIENLGSALVGLGNNTASTESMIMDFSLRIAGVGNVVGLTEGDVMGLAAAMASAGVQAERGGTATSKVLLEINKAVTTGGKNLDTFAEVLGLTREEFRRLGAEDPSEIFIRFVEALRDAGDQATAILNRLGLNDQRLLQSFLSLAQSSMDVRTTMQLGNQEFVKANALAEEAERRFNTLTQTFQSLRNATAEVRRSLGQYLVPIVTKFVQLITGSINTFNHLLRRSRAVSGRSSPSGPLR
jgi:TP901 family phage tail tape measure protein